MFYTLVDLQGTVCLVLAVTDSAKDTVHPKQAYNYKCCCANFVLIILCTLILIQRNVNMLGGVGSVAPFIIVNEQTQSNGDCSFHYSIAFMLPGDNITSI